MPIEVVSQQASTVDDILKREVAILKPNAGRCGNLIKTSRFNLLSFVPITLYELLHPWKRFANFYFLCVGAMQMVPVITLTDGNPSTWMTLSFLVLVDMVVMAAEDMSRHKADRETNTQKVDILRASDGASNEWVRLTWADVMVGDVVRVMTREYFPADLLLLRASDPPGQCWVNTKPLDGESDTKMRLAPKLSASLLGDDCSPAALRTLLRGSVRVEEPNDKVNDFTGQLCIDGKERLLVSEDNMLLRGCQLRNTEWVVGLVLACGTESKINFKGGKGADKAKSGTTMVMVNQNIIGVVLCLLLVCAISSSLGIAWQGAYDTGEPWYLDPEAAVGGKEALGVSAGKWFQAWGTYFLLLYQFIPVSLYVSMNMIWTISRYFMQRDLEMYDGAQDEPCRVRSMGLIDELGQISHIFSDKTGTLTSNHMEFRRVVIDGMTYGVGDTAISRSVRENAGGGPVAPLALSTAKPPGWASLRPCSSTFVSFEEGKGAPSLFDALQEAGAAGAMRRELMVAMAVNHSVLLETVHSRLELSASSPDEQAFVAAAEHFGYEFSERDADANTVTLTDKRNGVTHVVKLLEVFPYESSRKRMSIIVELPPALLADVGGGCPYRLYCKGADSVLLDLLAPGSAGTDDASMEKLNDLLYEWADIALRTLVWGRRELTNYDDWHALYEMACQDPSEVRKHKTGQPSRIGELQAEAEAMLTLQGATAIEDKLQDGVPEVLADLRASGIKVWMLTGDKVGTAKNIATACNILPAKAEVLEITCETFPALADLKTAEIMMVQDRLAAAREAAAVAEGRCARLMRRAGLQKAMAPGAGIDREIEMQTEELDRKYPGLLAVREALEERRAAMAASMLETRALSTPRRRASEPEVEYCFVLDEKAIEYCGTLCAEVLAAVGNGSRSVVACRARKDQKAQMLNLIREGVPGSCCLAIGDGANDVAMIKAGHVGVGIIGKEGMQAVNNSDFAIGQFSFLRGLLLSHGRYNYRRMAIFTYYMFYKNVANVMCMWFYSLLCLASSTRYFITAYIEVYNIMFTALPIIIFGFNDQDVPKAEAALAPRLYTAGIRRIYFTHAGFWRWMVEAFVTALLIAYIPVGGLGWGAASLADPELGDTGVYSYSFVSMSLVCVCMNLRLALEMHSWGKLEHLFMWGTITVFELVFLFFCTVPTFSFLETSTYNWNTMLYVMPTLYTQPAFWFTMVLTIALALFPRFVGKATHALQELTPAKRVLREIAANNRRAQSRLRRSVEVARVHNLTASGRITVEPSAGSAQLSAQRSTGVAVSAQSMSAATGSYGSRGDDAPPTVSGRARSLSTSQSFSTRKSGFAFSTHEATTNSVFASLGAMNASFVAGDTLKGNVDSMRSPRGARASPTLGSVKEASQRRSDAPAPQVGARKASAVSNVI